MRRFRIVWNGQYKSRAWQSGGTLAEFDYARFARAYMGRWLDHGITNTLTRMYNEGFEYEDRVN